MEARQTIRIAVMNNPYKALEEEVRFLDSLDADTLELSLEPPEWSLDLLKKHVSSLKNFSIGHTRGDFPFAHRDPAVRNEAIEEITTQLHFFYEAGIRLVGLHPDKGSAEQGRNEIITLNAQSFCAIISVASALGIEILIENQQPIPRASDCLHFLQTVEGSGLLFDMAHAFYQTGDAGVIEYIENLHPFIKHVHVCDNFGKSDDHLFLGAGAIDFRRYLSLLKERIPRPFTVTIESYQMMDSGRLRVATQEERGNNMIQSIAFLRKILA